MKWHETRHLATVAGFTAGTVLATMVVLWPRPTHAEEIPDWERQGEWDEGGMKFGNIVVSGKLVADVAVPGGWALVRTFENTSDEPEKCRVEERVLRTETMPDARVTPPPTAVLLRNQPIALGPHEKRTLGIPLPQAIGDQITAGLRAKDSIEAARARAAAAERWDELDSERTYMEFHVEYLTPLPPGATAAPPPDTGVTQPGRMPSARLVGMPSL